MAAARGMLGWSQKELSRRTNITPEAINRIERGEVENPRLSTIQAIQEVFEAEGIEFIEQSGIRLRSQVVREFTGEDRYLKMLDDAFYTLKKGEELLVVCSDDRVSPSAINDSYRRLRNAGVGMRQIVEDGNTYLMGGLDEYRYLPKKYFHNNATIIYGDKVGVVISGQEKVLIVRDKELAASLRNLFNFMWSATKKPAESNADEKF